MNLKNVKISRQLNLSLFIILALVLSLGITSLFNFNSLGQNAETLYKHSIITQRAISLIKTDILSINLEMNGLILENKQQKTQEYLSAVDKYEADAYEQINILYTSYPGPKNDIDSAYNSLAEYQAIHDETIRLFQTGESGKSAQRLNTIGVEGVQERKVMSNLETINGFSIMIEDQLHSNIRTAETRNLSQLAITFGILLVFIGCVSTYLRKGILSPLKELTAATESFQQGKLETRSRYSSANEFGRLSHSFNAMTETIQSEMQIREKQTTELIRANKKIKESNKVISDAEEYYHSLIEASLNPLVTIGPNGVITDVNTAMENATGLQREELVGTDFSGYFTEPEKAKTVYQQVFRAGAVTDYELELKHINGKIIPVLYNAAIYKDNNGSAIGVFAVARDISESRKTEDELLHLKKNLEFLVDQRTEDLRIANKKLSFQNKEKEKRAAELLIANTELAFQNKEKEKRAAELLIANTELAFQNKEKEKRAAELLIANTELAFQNKEKENRATELHIAYRELAFQNEKVTYLNYHDFLTGLYNRAFFEEEKIRLDTERQLPISIVMGDINGLKLINDGFGHAKGDEVLVEIAKILKSCGRDEDVIARIGGDEFGIILPQTDSASAQLVCNRIYNACITYERVGDRVYPSISLGHSTKTVKSESINDVLIAADESMARQKLLDSRSAHSSILASIKVIMFEKSQETEEHAERLVELSRSIGLAMSLSDDQLNELKLLSTLHDIGKMGVSASILSKQGSLSSEEWREIKKHPEIGFRIAQSTSDLVPIAKYILCHHERWDGSGYPQGLEGENIPLLSRILSIVDSFDAMTNDRAYRPAMTKKEAIEEIEKCAGSQFDPDISRIFLRLSS